MSMMPETHAAAFPDDAPYDAIAYATGAEGYDRGVTWKQLSEMDALLVGAEEPLFLLLGWRKSYCFGYLAAMRVRAWGRRA